MKKLINILILVATLGAFTGCGDSTFTAADGRSYMNSSFNDPVTPYEESANPEDREYTTNHCQDINVTERVFYGNLKSMIDPIALELLLEAEGVCTRAGNGFQTYPGFIQYEVHGGTNRCSWWARHGIEVYINFVKGYKKAAVVTIEATGDGWPQGGGQGFPTARLQFTNAIIDCSKEDLTLKVNTNKGTLRVTAPKETGNKYSPGFRASVSYEGRVISKGAFRATE